jgi:hypothetical protein
MLQKKTYTKKLEEWIRKRLKLSGNKFNSGDGKSVAART